MNHPSAEQLAAYWLGELPEADAQALEEHVFACGVCTAASARMAALPRAIAVAVRAIVSTADAARIKARDPLVRRVVVAAGERAIVDFSAGAHAQLVAFQTDLQGVTRVDVRLSSLDGETITVEEDVPFDSEAGTITIACRVHFATAGQFPLEVSLHAEAIRGGLRHSLGSIVLDHILPV
jgi:hypothetical protein